MENNNSDTQLMLWEVFMQTEQGGAHVHAGSLHASDAEMALMNARDVYARRGPVYSIWVVPAEAIKATSPGDNGSFFDPAEDKIYRHPQFYKVPKGIRNV
ncbi:MAG: 1,2-phenylacetyl-CoA epoxidase subunit PaaB [Syntrophothermus sp.]